MSTVVGLTALVGLIIGVSLIEYYGPLADAYNSDWKVQDANEFYDFLGYMLMITGGVTFVIAIMVRGCKRSSPVTTVTSI